MNGFGIDDKENKNKYKDERPLDNKVTGKITMLNGKEKEVDTNMYYRYFFMDKYNYYDELARMSLIMSNAVSNGNGGADTNEETKEMHHINTAMQSIGMTCEYSDVSKDNFIAGLAIGHNEVEYYDIKKNIVLVAVSNARNIVEYSSFADIGKSDWSTTLNNNHSKAHEILANEVYNRINTYLTTHNINENVVYWVTDYGTGGGIANLLSEKLIDNPLISTNTTIEQYKKFLIFTYGKEKVSVPTGMTNVYTYTFGAPNVVYTEDKDMGINNNKYKSIFNIVDASDVSAHMPTTATGWNKYGWNMVLTEKAEKCREVINEYNLIMENKSREDIYIKQGNDEKTIKEILEYVAIARSFNDIENKGEYFKNMNAIKAGSYKIFLNKYYAHYKELEPKHSIKNYYNLCKKLLPEHMKIGDGWKKRIIKPDNINEFIKSIEKVGDWYIHNVYTYQGAHKYKSDIETMAQSAHPNAKAIWDAKKASISDTEFAMKSTSDKMDTDGKYLNNDAIYKCNLFTKLDYNKDEVVDDCSKFATAVYYYYYNEIGQDILANEFDLIYTGSGLYSKVTSKITEKLEKDKRFKVYIWKDIQKDKDFELQPGDLIYRQPKTEGGTTLKSGHVEFYLGDNKVFGWGRIHDTFDIDKTFTKGEDGFYSDDDGDCYNGESQPYVTVIRYVGGGSNE